MDKVCCASQENAAGESPRKVRERAAKGLFLGEGILDNPHIGVTLGTYWDDGKENGNYYLRFRGLGFRVWGLGLRACDLGLGFRVQAALLYRPTPPFGSPPAVIKAFSGILRPS